MKEQFVCLASVQMQLVLLLALAQLVFEPDPASSCRGGGARPGEGA